MPLPPPAFRVTMDSSVQPGFGALPGGGARDLRAGSRELLKDGLGTPSSAERKHLQTGENQGGPEERDTEGRAERTDEASW